MSPTEAKAVTLRIIAPLLALMAGTVQAPGLTLNFASPAVLTANSAEPMASYPLPVGPYAAGAVATKLTEGPLNQSAWRLGALDQTTLELLQPLRDQVTAAGFKVLYECEAQTCGGFDFRFATEVLPEPDMHVDLGDYRYLAAERRGPAGPEYVSLIVSRGAGAGFVQITRVGKLAEAAPALTASTKSAETPLGVAAQSLPLVTTAQKPTSSGDLGPRLLAGGAQVLEALEFESGKASLAAGDFASLAALADWLEANPAAKVALVGHTDASGGLEGNIALSRKRAISVRQRLVNQYGIASARVSAEGVGYLSPRDSNLTEVGRMRNRRVEVMLVAVE